MDTTGAVMSPHRQPGSRAAATTDDTTLAGPVVALYWEDVDGHRADDSFLCADLDSARRDHPNAVVRPIRIVTMATPERCRGCR